jgi:protoporphyrinogen/coproporphyrinogen III oxidase
VTAIDLALERDAPGVFLAGASYRGIGIPACIADGKKTANTVCAFLNATRD